MDNVFALLEKERIQTILEEMKKIVFVLLCAISARMAYAQSEKSGYAYPQKNRPALLDTYSFTGYYAHGPYVCNLRQATLCKAPGDIEALRINPAGSSFAVLTATRNRKLQISIYDLWKTNVLLHTIVPKYAPAVICYAPDAKSFAVADTDRKIHLYDTRTYAEKAVFGINSPTDKIAISPNNYFLAAECDHALLVYNLHNQELRKEISLPERINGFAFSADNSLLAILTAKGSLTLYDTRSFLPLQQFGGLGSARNCDIHADGKYIAVATDDNRIVLLNRMNGSDRRYIENKEGGIQDVRFVKDGKGQSFLLYNTTRSIVYALLGDLRPNYTQLLADELDEKMNVWMKQMDGESLDDYHARVNDRTRAQQMAIFEQEIATRMADDLLAISEVSLGNFNPETNTLAIEFDTMPSIYLNIPPDKVAGFSDTDDLEFRNAVYGVTANDDFELVYVNVYNKRTGEIYTFDNRERRSLEYLQSDDRFVPLELVQLSNLDEIKLREIRNDIVSQARKTNRISDHTQVAVNTAVISDANANGEKIHNYRIGFSYNVEKDFSAREDFAPGRYRTEQSAAALSMIAIIKTAFENEFSQYVKAGKKVRIVITGMADRLPINGRIAYNGAYGTFVNEPVYGEQLYALTVTPATGITKNDQLAFIRAAGVKSCIARDIRTLEEMDAEYEYHIKVTDKAGGEYRRISVDFIFVDAF